MERGRERGRERDDYCTLYHIIALANRKHAIQSANMQMVCVRKHTRTHLRSAFVVESEDKFSLSALTLANQVLA